MIQIEFIQLLVEFLQLCMHRVLKQIPVELFLIVPLVKLADFSAHEGELLAGVSDDIGHEGSQSGKLLPVVARHLLEHGGLAVHHFIVGKCKHKMFGEGIHQREGQKVVIIRTIDRIHREVSDRVVHPAHVPLEGEAQTAVLRLACDLRPCGGFLGDHHRVWIILVDSGVEHLEELNGFEVLVSAVDIGHPFAVVAVVVEVEHRCDSVDAQTVDVILVEPEQSVGDEEGTDFVAAKVEYAGAPFLVLALAPVGIFIGRCAVKAVQTVCVLGEVSRNPVHNNADAVLMHDIDELHEVLRLAVTRCGSVVTADLVAP